MKKATIYVGIEKAAGGRRVRPWARYLALQELKRKACTLCGGYSLTFAEGGWVNPLSRELATERVARFELFGDLTPESVDTFAAACRDALRQECVLVHWDPHAGGKFV